MLLIDEKPGGGFDMAATAYNEISGQHVGPDAKGAGGVSVSYKEVDARCACDMTLYWFWSNVIRSPSALVLLIGMASAPRTLIPNTFLRIL